MHLLFKYLSWWGCPTSRSRALLPLLGELRISVHWTYILLTGTTKTLPAPSLTWQCFHIRNKFHLSSISFFKHSLFVWLPDFSLSFDHLINTAQYIHSLNDGFSVGGLNPPPLGSSFLKAESLGKEAHVYPSQCVPAPSCHLAQVEPQPAPIRTHIYGNG